MHSTTKLGAPVGPRVASPLDHLRPWTLPERDEAIRLVRTLRRDLSKLEASLRATDALDAGRELARLQQAGLELMGFGWADQPGQARHNPARFELVLTLVVRHAATSFVTDHAGTKLPDPNQRPQPRYDEFPDFLVALVSAQLDAVARFLPALAAKILPAHAMVLEHLVYATSVRASALRAKKKRSNYLDWVVRALLKGKVSARPNVERLKQHLQRYA